MSKKILSLIILSTNIVMKVSHQISFKFYVDLRLLQELIPKNYRMSLSI